MTEGENIVRWINELAHPDASVRSLAAYQLRSAVLIKSFYGINSWIRDPEFYSLNRPFAVDAKGDPRMKRAPIIVGIAVQPETFERIRAAEGSPRLADVPPDLDAMEFELGAGANGIDVLTTREPGGSGAIARYLQKFGEGVQQIEVNVTDVDRATEILRTRFGLAPIYPATRPGADGTRVNFFLVPGPDGKKLLIELVEPSEKS